MATKPTQNSNPVRFGAAPDIILSAFARAASDNPETHFAANRPPAANGATGNPCSPAGRATPILERGHWGFDPVAYRQTMLAQLFSPAMGAAVGCSVIAIASWLLVAVAVGY